MVLGTPTLLDATLTGTAGDTDGTVFTTGAVTPTAGSVVFVAVLGMLSVSDRTVTVVDSGANAFAQRAYTRQPAGVDTHLLLFSANADSLVSGSTLTITWNSTMSSCTAIVFEVTGANLTTPLAQVKEGTIGTGTTAGDTFANPFSDAANITLLLVSTRQQQTITPDGSLSELTQTSSTLTPSSLSVMYLAGEDSSPSATIDSADWAVIIAEIQAEPAAPVGGVFPHRRYYQRHGG